MKKRIIIALCLIIAIALSTACASGSGGSYDEEEWRASTNSLNLISSDYALAEPMSTPAPAPMPAMETMMDSMDMDYQYSESGYTASGNMGGESDSGGIVPISAPVTEGLAEKIIYSYWADIETMAFDETIENVNALILEHGAFVENSNVSGATYHSMQRGMVSYRYAHFQIRVPVEQLNAVAAKLVTLGNVTHQSSNATNITSQFIDTESRLNTLRVQEERLLDMLKKAEDVADMIIIEESLSNVRYQIESLTSTLTNWQRQVDYSTLTLNISEVEEYKEIVAPNRTYWERMADGFLATMRGVGSFFTGLFMWLVVSAPVLLILAIIALVVVVIVKRSIRKSREKRKAAPQPNAPPYPPYYAPPQRPGQPPQPPPQEQPQQNAPPPQQEQPPQD